MAGTGFAITYSIVLFFPAFDPVECESHLKKQTKALPFPSPFPILFSGAALRDFLSTHSQLQSQNSETAIQWQVINGIKTGDMEKKIP